MMKGYTMLPLKSLKVIECSAIHSDTKMSQE